MTKLFSFKLIFIAIFLFLTIAIKNCENFQFRNLDGKEVSKGSDKKSVGGSKTNIRYPFRKLEFSLDDEDNDDSEDIEDDDEDEDDDEESLKKFKFAKVRKGKFEVKKRPNLRFSKLAQFRDSNDKDSDPENDDDDSEEESGEKKSFFSKIISRFTSYFKREKENDEDQEENTSAEDNENEDDENKPLLTEMFEKFKSFLEARNQKPNAAVTSEEDDNENEENSSDDEIESESMLRNALRNTFTSLFNRPPFNLIFDFDDSDDDGTEVKSFEDSEEDEINYQKLLKQEREQEEQKTEKLISQVVEEETSQPSEEPANDADILDDKKEEKSETQAETAIIKKSQKSKKTKEEVHLAQKQFEKLLLNLPSFIPDYAKVKNHECQKQGKKTHNHMTCKAIGN